jgi:hypothetical protein
MMPGHRKSKKKLNLSHVLQFLARMVESAQQTLVCFGVTASTDIAAKRAQ